jgi:glycosyltransferase involved in cell wall biosynthesis
MDATGRSLPLRHIADISKILVGFSKELLPDIIYVRLNTYNLLNYWCLKRFKKHCRVLIGEIPTYPYEGEFILLLKSYWENRSYKILFNLIIMKISERLHRPFLKKQIDFVVTYMKHDHIWGIPVRVIENGVNVDEVRLKADRINGGFELVLISVAFTQSWNGFDRVIRGIAEYKKRGGAGHVLYRVVGDGPYIPALKSLAEELGLTDSVLFYGTKDGAELDGLFDKSDIAISTIAYHRVGLENSGSTLKVKEYCARGIPFVYASNERAINKNDNFALKIESSEAPVDINEILDFKRELETEKDLKLRMREFAMSNYDWSVQMEKIFKDII